jgi:exopolysaccharide transport family protein
MGKPPSQYSPETRKKMIDLVREGRTPEDLALEFEPSAHLIQSWIVFAESEQRDPVRAPKTKGGGSHIAQFVELVREEDNKASAREISPRAQPVQKIRPDGAEKPPVREVDSGVRPVQKIRPQGAETSHSGVRVVQKTHLEGAEKSPARESEPDAQPGQETPRQAESHTRRPPTATTSQNVATGRSPQLRFSPNLPNDTLPIDRSDQVNLGQQLRILWERKWIVVATVIVSMLVAFIYTRQLVPLYTAQSLILIESRLPEIAGVGAVVGGLTADDLTIHSEVSVLASRVLAERVIERVELNEDPEFNPALRQAPQGWRAQLTLVRTWVSDLLRGSSDSGAPTALAEHDQNAAVIDRYLKRLQVSLKNKSRAIRIKFTAANPATAALVANTVADLYMLSQRESKLEATQQATAWLNERSAALREKVVTSERMIEQFREDNELLQGARGALVSEQITDVNAELMRAATNSSQLKARLAQVKRLALDANDIDSAVEVLDSPVIQNLREDHVNLVRQKAELSARFNPSHTRIVSLDAEIAFLEQQIAAEIEKIVKGMENEVEVAQAHEASLRKNLEEFKVRASQASSAVVQLRELEREAEADRLLLTTFLSRLKETSAQKDIEFHRANARILSKATVPRQPLPTQKVILAVTFVGSLLIGVLLVVLLEKRRTANVFLSGEQIERFARVPYLSLIPFAPVSKDPADTPSSYVVKKPRSAFAESIRGLYASIQLTTTHAPPKTVMFTSAQPNEGKTTIAVSLARAQALNGKKVVIIDTDMRRPGVYKPFAVRNEPGLSDLLLGSVSIEEVVQTDTASGANVISAGSGTISPFDTLCAKPMEDLLNRLANSYDLVILDTPPLLAVPDARILSGKVDATVFVIRWAKTNREMAALAMRQIDESNGYLAGAVLSMVDMRKNAKYGYGDSGYYSGAASSYYHGAQES